MEDEPPLPTLEALLDAELAALRTGAFAGLEEMAARKEALLAELLSDAAPDPAELDGLRARARRNAAALAAARRGIRAASRRLAELARAGAPETYDANGQRQAGAPAARQLEKRA